LRSREGVFGKEEKKAEILCGAEEGAGKKTVTKKKKRGGEGFLKSGSNTAKITEVE